jgi:hypothetical protein
LIALVLDLVDKDILGPTKLLRHPDVEFAFQIIFALGHDHQMLGPTDFSNQWLEFWVRMIRQIELTHVP